MASLQSLKKGVGSGFGSISQRYGSADPDPNQNVTDPQHCLKAYGICYRACVEVLIEQLAGFLSSQLLIRLNSREICNNTKWRTRATEKHPRKSPELLLL